jgi:hypothetical protein
VFIAREERSESPRGEWRGRLWYPEDGERQPCCAAIQPTEANRQALESHCRTQAHVAHLFGVPLPALRRAVKSAREAMGRAAGPAFGLRSLASPASRADVLVEVSRSAQGDALLELRAEARSFQTVLPRLITAGEDDEELPELLEEAAARLNRLHLAVEYCQKVDETFDAAQAVRDLVARFHEQAKKSA